MTTLFPLRKKALAMTAGFFSCLIIGFSSCKERGISGADAIPEVDNINTFEWEGQDLSFVTFYKDSLWTNDYNYSLATVGNITDPYFGKTYGGVYFQVAVPILGFQFPDDIIVDSSVVSVPLFANAANRTVAYGDTNTTITFNAYRITDNFVYDASKRYFAHDSLAYQAQALGSTTATMQQIKDSITLNNGTTVNNLLRIKLNNAFTQELASLPASQTGLSATFQEYFKGFYIAPSTPASGNYLGVFILDQGSVASYKLAQLTFYYHTADDTTTKKFEFPFNNTLCAWFNAIRKDYSGFPAQRFTMPTPTDSVIVQSAPGIATDVTIQLDTNIGAAIVHKATLQLTTLQVGSDDAFTPPIQLIVKGLNDNGEEYDLMDFNNASGYEFIGGIPSREEVNGNTLVRYYINLPREIQWSLAQKKNNVKLRIYASSTHPGIYRAIFGGTQNDADHKASFKMVYSKK